MDPIYKRVLIKVSGEALAGDSHFGIDDAQIADIAEHIKILHDMGVQIGIVVGGGNFWRGRQGTDMDRTRADHMGMLATVINALGLASAIENTGLEVRVHTAIDMHQIAQPYVRGKAIKHLQSGKIVIFGCGTGNPFFTTDTVAALRAVEIEADVILLAKNVDAVYDSDPAINPDAKKFDKISYMEVLEKNLKVMDTTATSLCMDNNMKIHVFGIKDPENLVRAIAGEEIGTVVS